MAFGRWLSSHRPTDKYKEVRGAHQTADGAIWLGSEVNHHPRTLQRESNPQDVDDLDPVFIKLSENRYEVLSFLATWRG